MPPKPVQSAQHAVRETLAPAVTWMDRVFGRRLPSSSEDDVKITAAAGVPVLGLDALASAAYGPEAALTVLLVLGTAGLSWIGPLVAGIIALLLLVFLSYRQVIAAYPDGGGAYVVARTNLGTKAGLLAAACLMVDYVLNAAVGISAGVGALVSALPALLEWRLPLCLVLLALITFMNLRGTRETGRAFMIPTVWFVGSLLLVIAIGAGKAILGGGVPTPVEAPPAPPAESAAGLGVAGLALILHAFAAGCTSLTGVEAVSNGVTTFRRPAADTARRSLAYIVGTLAVLLAGIAYLCTAYGITATDPNGSDYQSVLSMLTAAVIGRGPAYYAVLAGVLAVLCLSANTSFAGLPQVMRLLAKDDYLPHGLASRGRRLVHTAGIGVVAVSAAVLLVAFGGVTDHLIPLFAVGAFGAFTLSQAGMVAHWIRARELSYRLLVNAVGTLATLGALGVIVYSKFADGAWASVFAIGLCLLAFAATAAHYANVRRQVAVPRLPVQVPQHHEPIVVLPVKDWDATARKGLRFASAMSNDVHVVHVSIEGSGADLARDWDYLVGAPCRAAGRNVPNLVVLPSPYRQLVGPLVDYVESLETAHPHDPIVVVVPDLVEGRWYHHLFHNHRAAILKTRLHRREDKHVVVASVPWYLH